jgi:molecular chaperone DnaK
LVFQTEKQIKEYGDKIPADKKEAIETAKADLKKAVEAQDLAAIDAGTEALNKAWEAASQDLYNAQQAAGGEGTGDAGDASSSSEGGSTDDVEDVDFEEVK